MAHPATLPASHTALAQLHATGDLPALSRVAIRVAWIVALWSRRRRTRAALARLADAQLDDVGLSRRAAQAETQKPFWTP